MTMKLIGSLASPFVRKVRIVMAEKKLDAELVLEDVWGNDAILQSNPLGKVPVLFSDEGDPLYDSPVICEYLDSLNGGSKLFPTQGEARWNALRLQALGDGIVDSVVALTHDSRYSETCDTSAAWYQKQLKKIEGGLAERGALRVIGAHLPHTAAGQGAGEADLQRGRPIVGPGDDGADDRSGRRSASRLADAGRH